MFYALALFNVFVATVAQMLLKKAAITPHKSFLKEYLNPWVIGGYSLMVFSLVSNVYVLSQGVLLKELGTFFVHPLTYTLICHDIYAAMYHDILPPRITCRRIRSLFRRQSLFLRFSSQRTSAGAASDCFRW